MNYITLQPIEDIETEAGVVSVLVLKIFKSFYFLKSERRSNLFVMVKITNLSNLINKLFEIFNFLSNL